MNTHYITQIAAVPNNITPQKYYHCRRFSESDAIPDKLDVLWLFELYSKQPAQESGFAFLWLSQDYLHVYCVMQDSDVITLASGKNDKTWEKGDVMEFFLQPNPELTNYIELHLAPNQATLEYAIPDSKLLKSYSPEMLSFESGMETETGLFEQGWWGQIRLPLKKLAFSSNLAPRFCICRYNYNRQNWENPELSSTTLFHSRPHFHQPDEWQTLIIK